MSSSSVDTNTDGPAITRWKPYDDIPNLVHIAPKIARIFGCDEQSVRRDDLITFIETTEGTAPSWDILVATAAVDGTIAPTPPPTHAVNQGFRPRISRPDITRGGDGSAGDLPLPELKPGMQYDAVLRCPVVKAAGSGPDRLTLLLFAGDREGYMNWLPRFRDSKAFKGLDRIKPGQEIRLPSLGDTLIVDKQASGKEGIVLVVAAEELPLAIQAGLEAPVKYAGLAPALALLARWLTPRQPGYEFDHSFAG